MTGLRALVPILSAALLAVASSVASAQTAQWAVGPAQSSIEMQVQTVGIAREGRFRRWSGDFRFDPADPSSARVTVEVRADSLTLQSDLLTRQAVGPGFLDAERYPVIRFDLRSLSPLSQDRYLARADVTLKGRTQPVSFPVSLAMVDDRARMRGSFRLDRRAFGVGTRGAIDALVARDVTVTVAIDARRMS